MQVTANNEITESVMRAKQRLGIVGNAPALLEAVSRAIRVAPIDLSVLINGESGTGKEFFPQIIHQWSARKHNKYIAVNCGAIPEGTIDSELFGHEKGAFTGAIASRKGYFEEADLVKAVEAGRFREDLYYRLSTVQITVPPLRSRGNDIMLLARKFMSDFAERYKMPPVEFDPSAVRALSLFMWPGNVRQLKNVTEQISLFEAGNTVDEACIASYLPAVSAIYTPVKASEPSGAYSREREMLFNMIFRLQREIDELKSEIDSIGHSVDNVGAEAVTGSDTTGVISNKLARIQPIPPALLINAPDAKTLSDTERETIRQSLERNGGRRKATASELNISERTLYRKIKEYGLE